MAGVHRSGLVKHCAILRSMPDLDLSLLVPVDAQICDLLVFPLLLNLRSQCFRAWITELTCALDIHYLL